MQHERQVIIEVNTEVFEVEVEMMLNAGVSEAQEETPEEAKAPEEAETPELTFDCSGCRRPSKNDCRRHANEVLHAAGYGVNGVKRDRPSDVSVLSTAPHPRQSSGGKRRRMGPPNPVAKKRREAGIRREALSPASAAA